MTCRRPHYSQANRARLLCSATTGTTGPPLRPSCAAPDRCCSALAAPPHAHPTAPAQSQGTAVGGQPSRRRASNQCCAASPHRVCASTDRTSVAMHISQPCGARMRAGGTHRKLPCSSGGKCVCSGVGLSCGCNTPGMLVALRIGLGHQCPMHRHAKGGRRGHTHGSRTVCSCLGATHTHPTLGGALAPSPCHRAEASPPLCSDNARRLFPHIPTAHQEPCHTQDSS